MLQKFQPTHFSHQSKSDLYFQHTSALHIHRAHYCPPQQVNTTCSSTLQLQHKGPYIIRIAYFNTATTKPMANTTNIVTFTHPHTRQMQLPKPSLFLPTIFFTSFRFCSNLSIFPTSSGTSVVEAAAMVEEAGSR